MGARARAILDAALDVFAESGVAGARVAEVARRAGVGKGTVYHYHASKNALFEAVIRDVVAPTAKRLEAMGEEASRSADAVLEAQIRLIYEQVVMTNARKMVRLVVAEGVAFPGIATYYQQEVIQRITRGLQATIRRGVAEGVFRETALDKYANQAVAPAILASLWLETFPPAAPVDLDAYIASHIELVRGALHPR